jgi:hypothetical protein
MLTKAAFQALKALFVSPKRHGIKMGFRNFRLAINLGESSSCLFFSPTL